MLFKLQTRLLTLCGALLLAPGISWAANLAAQNLESGPVVIDTNAFTYTDGGGEHPYAAGDTIVIDQADPSTATANTVTVLGGSTVNVQLGSVNIDVSATNNACAFDIQDASAVILTLSAAAGSPALLKSGDYCAGLHVPGDAVLTIDGAGSLTATGGRSSAGIGGGGNESAGVINIRGGTITANGSTGGAGIGDGIYAPANSSPTIDIRGGTVTANGGGAGIGGGDVGGAGATINIYGDAVVTATGGSYCAGIGSGDQTTGGSPTISIYGSATVTAKGGFTAAGIGSGYGGGTPDSAGVIYIDETFGATVTAIGGGGAAGYGAGAPIGEGGHDNGDGAGIAPVTLPDATVVLGGDAAFTCNVSTAGTTVPGISYAWGISTDQGATWDEIAGETAASLNVPGVTAAMMDNNRYSCEVKASGGGLTGGADIDFYSSSAKLALPTPIASAAVSVTAPVEGNAPAAAATPAGGSHFAAGAVTWSPADNPFMTGASYTATVTLTADPGYTFTGLAAADATFNGQAATDAVVSAAGDTVTLTYVFPPLAPRGAGSGNDGVSSVPTLGESGLALLGLLLAGLGAVMARRRKA